MIEQLSHVSYLIGENWPKESEEEMMLIADTFSAHKSTNELLSQQSSQTFINHIIPAYELENFSNLRNKMHFHVKEQDKIVTHAGQVSDAALTVVDTIVYVKNAINSYAVSLDTAIKTASYPQQIKLKNEAKQKIADSWFQDYNPSIITSLNQLHMVLDSLEQTNE